MLAYDFIGIVGMGLQDRKDVCVVRSVAERDRDVASPVAVARSTQGHAFGFRQVLRLAPAEELDQLRLVEAVSRNEVRFRAHLRVAVPGAYQLAVVAAEDAIAHQRTQFERYGTVMLDGQVGDAAACIELIGTNEGVRRADIEAGPAAAAVIARRFAFVRRQRQIGVNLAEQEAGPGLAVEQQRVLADPAEPGVARHRTLQRRCTVGEHTVSVRSDLFFDAGAQALEPAAQELVIIAAQCVAGDVGTPAVGKQRPGVVNGRPAIHPYADDADGPLVQGVRPSSLLGIARHVLHAGMMAGGQPAAQVDQIFVQGQAGNAGIGESEFQRPFADAAGEVGAQDGVIQGRMIQGRPILDPMNAERNGYARRLYGAAQVREMDRRTIEDGGIPAYTLMQRAAAVSFRALQERWPQARHIAVLCGAGSNGGDGFEIARLARVAGLDVDVWQFGISPAGTIGARARDAWLVDGGLIDRWPEHGTDLRGAEVIVDAIFGTGLSRPPPAEIGGAIRAIAEARAGGCGVMAVDMPSGVMADTGCAPGEAIVADVTVTFIGNKLGLFSGCGPEHCGKVVFDPIGVDISRFEDIEPQAFLMEAADLREVLPQRQRQAHKGDHGHVLIIGGDHGMAGAALLAARGAQRAGAGLVTVATRAAHAGALTAAQPEIMFRPVETVEDLKPLLARASVIAIGPGLGQNEWGVQLWREVRQHPALIVDADALNLLAREPQRNEFWVLTPHPGEAARLLGTDSRGVQADRVESVKALHSRFGGTAVLKGAGTLVSGDGHVRLCHYGNPGMAVGGTGDVLCGIIAGLRAQGFGAHEAAATGVLVHALAGDRAAVAGERGLSPIDLLAEVRPVVNPA